MSTTDRVVRFAFQCLLVVIGFTALTRCADAGDPRIMDCQGIAEVTCP